MVVMRELFFNLGGSVTSQGLPVTGTLVRLYDYWHQAGVLVKHFLTEQTTTNKGTFSFDVRKGIYCVEIIPSSNTRFARQSFEAIKVTGNTTYDVILKSGVILSGTVRDKNAQAIVDAELLVFGIEPHVLRVSQKLDENGAFSLSLPQGKYYLALKHVEVEPEKGKKTASPFLCPFFQVIQLSKDTKHDITMPPLINFKGKVTDADGHPVGQAKVILKRTDKPDNIFSREIPTKISTQTARDGSFECLLQKGTYNVRLLPLEDLHLAEKTIPAIFVDQDRKRNYSLDTGYTLSGKVTANGKPVPNARVNVIGVNLDSVTLTDEEGFYRFALPGGSYDLVVAAHPDSLGTSPPMEIAPGQFSLILDRDTEHNVEMEPGVLVNGTVHDPSKQPRPGVQLALYATTDGEFDAQAAKRRPLWVGITGNDGTYEFRLHSNRYWLVLDNQPSTGHLIDVSGTKQTKELTIEDVCLICFEVMSENDEPIPNCQVSCAPFEINKTQPAQEQVVREIVMPAFTASDGRCSMTLPTGIYSFDFHPPEHSAFNSRLIRQLSVAADMTRRVRLVAKGE